jgi:transcriptional regulator with XRE-family HTH domain
VPRKASVKKKKKPKGHRPTALLRPLGAQIRRLRLDRDLAQERLAEAAGCSYKYLGRIELATANPTAVILIRLARALGVTVGKLFETITPAGGALQELPPPPRQRATRRRKH